MNPALQELRDIHLPPPVSWWPLALGWWLLLALLIALAIGVWLWYRKRRRVWLQEAWRREALQEIELLRSQLQSASRQQTLAQLSILIRRVVITCFPRHDVASLTGDRWLAFLELSMGEVAHADEFRAAGGQHLIAGPYQSQSMLNSSLSSQAQSLLPLLSLLERWLLRLSIQNQEQTF